MRDYKFGDFLRERRKALSLSQFQLGRLMGVSDKAISKWENGTSKPKSSLFKKLADIFDISVDELLQCKLYEKKGSTELELMENKIWESAKERLALIYGDNVPLIAQSRFEYEKSKLEGTFMPVLYSLIAKISAVSKENGYETSCTGSLGSSFIAYILGASSLNPLPPHYLCENCKCVHFMPEYNSAWDMPEKLCTCGNRMARIGHGIPFETVQSEIKCKYAASVVACEMMPKAVEIIKEMSAFMSVVCVMQSSDTAKKYNPYRFFFIPNSKPDFKIVNCNEEERYDLYANYSLSVLASAQLDKLHRLCVECDTKVENIFPESSMLDSLSAATVEGLDEFKSDYMKDLLLKTKPKSFYQLSKICGLAHGTGTWEEVGLELFENGVSLDNLIAFRDDVFIYVIEAMRKKGIYEGLGFAYEIMNTARRGLYVINGIKDKDKRFLEELELAPWFIPAITKLSYLFPKAHALYYVQKTIYLLWFKKHFPKKFDEIIL